MKEPRLLVCTMIAVCALLVISPELRMACGIALAVVILVSVFRDARQIGGYRRLSNGKDQK